MVLVYTQFAGSVSNLRIQQLLPPNLNAIVMHKLISLLLIITFAP